MSQCGSEEPQSIAHMISEVFWHPKKLDVANLYVAIYAHIYIAMHGFCMVHICMGVDYMCLHAYLNHIQ